ncbi:hypothetical protein N824_27050 [Pedobacter sp. V48]|nr:hypothetical protein N824_27050 [Pedobacter sp. V48]
MVTILSVDFFNDKMFIGIRFKFSTAKIFYVFNASNHVKHGFSSTGFLVFFLLID